MTRLGGGAALPFKRPLFARMIRSAVEAAGSIPVTVKFRMGVDEQHLTFLDAAALPRTKGWPGWRCTPAPPSNSMHRARWEAIGELVAALEVPVLGNGDIFEATGALDMIDRTGCAGVVIGRGCLGKPWLFSDLRAVLKASRYLRLQRWARRAPPPLSTPARRWRGEPGMRPCRPGVAEPLLGVPARPRALRTGPSPRSASTSAGTSRATPPVARCDELRRR